MEQKDFESALKALEEIVSKLEGGSLPLEEALTLFEQGVNLSRYCNGKLEEAERKVEILMKGQTGRLTPVEFPETPEKD
ncbi:MAG: exodeoxyribonuclease VII small subunit [Acidobacteria bacterium]|nr:exodeoxyribonuclease VII small subunit [Acidobacteriota bacterium]MBI3657305.1 exodeoxyribonuclease VII small subunit [Acidobacteriota bacterium]